MWLLWNSHSVGPSQVWWYAQGQLRPRQPPAFTPASGLLDSVMTLGSGGEGGECAWPEAVRMLQHRTSRDYMRVCTRGCLVLANTGYPKQPINFKADSHMASSLSHTWNVALVAPDVPSSSNQLLPTPPPIVLSRIHNLLIWNPTPALLIQNRARRSQWLGSEVQAVIQGPPAYQPYPSFKPLSFACIRQFDRLSPTMSTVCSTEGWCKDGDLRLN
ncbi:unnamed protein product [Schistocephalus solidus]|uniref:Peptidase S1 domain-containing protein n=1 Tax=Schistocephalus solidus TaxID=70667 RepID=A0A183SNA7_SCHSO|nr:unnamed protein product [Schistocephalus solidus]